MDFMDLMFYNFKYDNSASDNTWFDNENQFYICIHNLIYIIDNNNI